MAAICAAPVFVLANNQLLKNVEKAACHPSVLDKLHDENDKIKMKKNKFSAPLNMIAPTRTAQDERYLILIYIRI